MGKMGPLKKQTGGPLELMKLHLERPPGTCQMRHMVSTTEEALGIGDVTSVLAPGALTQGQYPQGLFHLLKAKSQDVLSRPSHLLLHPLNKVLLCSQHGCCVFLSILKILQCRKLGDVESFCQGLVDGGIDSCKDTRALGWGRGQPCMTASDAAPA